VHPLGTHQHAWFAFELTIGRKRHPKGFKLIATQAHDAYSRKFDERQIDMLYERSANWRQAETFSLR
jgi:hypothetical protein